MAATAAAAGGADPAGLYGEAAPAWVGGTDADTVLASAETRALLRAALARVRSLAAGEVGGSAAESGWVAGVEKRGVQVSQLSGAAAPGGADRPPCNRGRGVVAGQGVAEVRALLADITRRGEWDPFFEQGKAVADVDLSQAGGDVAAWVAGDAAKGEGEIVRCGVVRYATKSTMTVWSREFCVVAVVERNAETGTETIAVLSVDSPDVPADKKCVRARLFISGFVLTPTGDENKDTDISYLFQVDVAGWLPGGLVQKVNEQQPLGIIGIRKVLTGSA